MSGQTTARTARSTLQIKTGPEARIFIESIRSLLFGVLPSRADETHKAKTG